MRGFIYAFVVNAHRPTVVQGVLWSWFCQAVALSPKPVVVLIGPLNRQGIRWTDNLDLLADKIRGHKVVTMTPLFCT
jgi:hypothetical protein